MKGKISTLMPKSYEKIKEQGDYFRRLRIPQNVDIN